MSDFGGLLSNDYGFKRQGKSTPMAPPKRNPNPNSAFNFDIGALRSTSSSSNRNNFSDLGVFNDVVSGGRSKSTAANDFEDIFVGSGDSGHVFSSLPVFDKPVYDDEDLGSGKYADVFSSASSTAKEVDTFDDLLGGLNRKKTQSTKSKGGEEKSTPSFDDLLSGFGGTSTNRKSLDTTKKTSKVMGDPFVDLESTSPPKSSTSEIFSDPLEEIGKFNNSSRKKVEIPASGVVFDDIDPFDSFGKSVPVFSAEMNGREKDSSPIGTRPRASVRQTSSGGDVSQMSSVRSPERGSTKKTPVDVYQESPQSVFEIHSVSSDSHSSIQNSSQPALRSSGSRETNSYQHAPSDENVGTSNDIWLTVSEIPLFTQPTAAPPPSRPPPPRPARFSKIESHSFPTSIAQKKGSEYSSFGGPTSHFQSRKTEPAGSRGSNASPIDELEDFAMARTYSNLYGSFHVPMGEEEFGTNSGSAAAMREAVDKAEIKCRQVRGERESARVSKSRESAQIEKEEKEVQDAQERKFKEHQERLEHERRQRERDEEERRQREEEEIRRIEREREKRRIERERELARQAVDRAAREARERAAAEARSRAERAAVQKAHAEARGRAEKAAVQRVQAEARERAAAEAKERAEKASAEARDRARSEAREKEVRERTAETAARANQQKNENDLESFFGVGSRASSAPRPSSSKPAEATRTSVKSSTNVTDDLSSIFGGLPSSGDFQEVEGETEERRRARLERQQRTQERAAKALADKYARDLEAQKEQTERHRIGETLDLEIKRWATGKEGNLRALLSTMQYVLWPECGWQPISLTDLITGASVKKAYRKATLCIHPDKVQQKGATLQQKYIAEKVFDLLKEAWNKFNSEELF